MLLDIDGVISPLGGAGKHDDYLVYSIDWATWRIPNIVVNFLKEISNKVEFVGSSTWERDASGLFRDMGLKVSLYVSFEESEDPAWQKSTGLKRFVNAYPERKMIILDDQFPQDFIDFAARTKHATIVPIDGVLGLTEANMAQIRELL